MKNSGQITPEIPWLPFRKDCPAQHDLEELDTEENLRRLHAQDQAGLFLPDGDSLDAAPEDFAEITCVIDDKGNGRSKEASAFAAAPQRRFEDEAGEIENNQQLDHQRGTADNPDQRFDEGAQRPEGGHLRDSQQESQRDRSQQRDKEQFKRLQDAGIQRGENNGKLFRKSHGNLRSVK